jgi:hypothetical protein
VDSPKPRGRTGFSRFELLACILALSLVVVVVLPGLASSHARGDRVRCADNLRQIGNALRHFALEHDDYPPWRAQAGEDGNYNNPGKHELWFQYWWLRDSIGDPRILMDPGETRANARVAASWDLAPGGLMSYKNNAVSYILALDSTTFLPKSLLVADRHVSNVGFGGCSSGISTAARLYPGTDGSQVRWLNDVHGPFGNVTLTDGSVVGVDTEGLRHALRRNIDDANETHVMTANW